MSAIEELRQVFGKDSLQEACWFAYTWMVFLCISVTPLRQCVQEAKDGLPPTFPKPSLTNIGLGFAPFHYPWY